MAGCHFGQEADDTFGSEYGFLDVLWVLTEDRWKLMFQRHVYRNGNRFQPVQLAAKQDMSTVFFFLYCLFLMLAAQASEQTFGTNWCGTSGSVEVLLLAVYHTVISLQNLTTNEHVVKLSGCLGEARMKHGCSLRNVDVSTRSFESFETRSGNKKVVKTC